ncbi:MAG: hypothetical protein PHR16_09490 [Methylovulum sp.]|nr:hypothetical protein [Methylovulum sp.]
MSSFRFVTYIISFALFTALGGISINYIIDPYSVFGTSYFPEFGQLEERYLKIEYLKKHRDFNTFLIGSSRIGVIKTEDVDNNFNGAKTYNLTISQANQWDIEKHVEWLVKNMPHLFHVIVQIDWLTDFGSDRPTYKLMDEVHPDISGRSRLEFLMDYLTFFNMEGLKTKLKNNWGGIDLLSYDISKGYWTRPLRDKKIGMDCKTYVAEEKTFNAKAKPKKIDAAIITDSLTSIARYKDLLDKANVKLTVLFTPHNHHMLDAIDINDYEMFIKQLVNITELYNFMYYNKLTKDDCNYYETSHYRPLVGELIVQSLAGQPDKQSAIYRYVSKSSVDAHLEFLKANFSLDRAQ